MKWFTHAHDIDSPSSLQPSLTLSKALFRSIDHPNTMSSASASSVAASASASAAPVTTMTDVTSIQKLTPFDVMSRYCVGNNAARPVQDNPNALDQGFWGIPKEISDATKKAIAKKVSGLFYYSKGEVEKILASLVVCRWCQDHVGIACDPLNFPPPASTESVATAGDKDTCMEDAASCESVKVVRGVPVVFLNAERTALRSDLRCLSAYAHEEARLQFGDFTVLIEPVSMGGPCNNVPHRMIRVPDAPAFYAPTCTEFSIIVRHKPTLEAIAPRNAEKRAKNDQGKAAKMQEQPPQATPCFVVERLVVGGRDVVTTWQDEPLFCTSGAVRYTGFDWNKANAGSFVFRPSPEEPQEPLTIEFAARMHEWLPPVKTALAHVGMGEMRTEAAVSSMSNDGSAPYGRQAAAFGARGYDDGLDVAARTVANRIRKQSSAVPDRDSGVGQRVVQCSQLRPTTGRTFRPDATKPNPVTVRFELRCVQSADQVRKDNARVELFTRGMDFLLSKQKANRKRVRDSEESLKKAQEDLEHVNGEVRLLNETSADLVRYFLPEQLESISSGADIETAPIRARLDVLEQDRFRTAQIHFEL
jgi:hypothetical protein